MASERRKNLENLPNFWEKCNGVQGDTRWSEPVCMKPVKNIRKTAFWLGIALPSFALVATLWVAHVTNGQFNAAFESVTHTYKILNILEATQAHVADAETGQRGYLLTGNEDYFALRGAAMGAVNNDLQQLKILIRGNEMQEANLARLQIVVADRLDAKALEKIKGDKMAVALTDQGRDTMNQVRGLLFSMREQETVQLVQNQQTAEAKFLLDQTFSMILVGITAVALVMVVGAVTRIEHLRQIVTVCAWTGQVKDGSEWVRMEDYLKEQFGLSVSHGVSKEAAEKMIEDARAAAIRKESGLRPK
jgi:CHASE3 domain sensor protein